MLLGEQNLGTFIGEIQLKSALIVPSSEMTSSCALVERLTTKNVGAICTKTLAGSVKSRIRLRPYQFPLRCFGNSYHEAGSLLSVASAHVENLSDYVEELSAIADRCHKSSTMLIASYYDEPTDLSDWVRDAMALESAGADMLELNFSSPSSLRSFKMEVDRSKQIIGAIKARCRLPLGVKISPILEPLEEFVEAWEKEGLDFVEAHNAPTGILIDTEKEEPFGAPAIAGYVSGRVFLPYSLARIVRIKKVSSLSVIGVGGIYESSDALQYLLCGCDAIGVGSALYFKGPDILDDISSGIAKWMKRKGYNHLRQFLGKALSLLRDMAELKDKERFGFSKPPECPYIPFIKQEKCDGCGICAGTCIYGALTFGPDSRAPVADWRKCWSCGFCVGVCPCESIELRRRDDSSAVVWDNHGTASPFLIGGP